MAASQIDLKKEQLATLARPSLKYSFMARLFFKTFDLLTGSRTTLFKVKLLEILAGIPYQAWEIRQYHKLTSFYGHDEWMRQGRRLLIWARKAQDNEYQHLLLLHEKTKKDQLREPWFLCPVLVGLMVFSYRLFAWALAKFSLRRSIFFNAEFEDHAEHVYAEFVREHPEWEEQPVASPLAKAYGQFANWADLFRRISLDERDHRNLSLLFCGRDHDVIRYDGMPDDFDLQGGNDYGQ
jgi:ubiquinol oxidase